MKEITMIRVEIIELKRTKIEKPNKTRYLFLEKITIDKPLARKRNIERFTLLELEMKEILLYILN